MKTAVSSYSFSRLLQAGAMTQLDCVQKAAEMGFDAIEFVDILPHDGSAPEEYAGRLGEACKRAGLAVSNYTVGADFLTGSAGDLQAEVKRVCGQVDLAACLGAASMRHDATGGYPPAGRSWRALTRRCHGLPRAAGPLPPMAKSSASAPWWKTTAIFAKRAAGWKSWSIWSPMRILAF